VEKELEKLSKEDNVNTALKNDVSNAKEENIHIHGFGTTKLV
jgi:hypothetical protein